MAISFESPRGDSKRVDVICGSFGGFGNIANFAKAHAYGSRTSSLIVQVASGLSE